jgi:hypothetical protein
MELRWNCIDRENRWTRIKTCHSATFSTTNPTWIVLGANPGLRDENPWTNHSSLLNGICINLRIFICVKIE